MSDDAVQVGVLRLLLHLPGARSLKERRRVVVSLRDRIRSRFKVSCHELDLGDGHHRAGLAVTTAGSDGRTVEQALDTIRAFVGSQGGYLVSDASAEVFAWAPSSVWWERDGE